MRHLGLKHQFCNYLREFSSDSWDYCYPAVYDTISWSPWRFFLEIYAKAFWNSMDKFLRNVWEYLQEI